MFYFVNNLYVFSNIFEKIYEWELDEVSFSVITPYPGTRLFNRYNREGRIICRDWSKYHEGKVNYTPKGLTEKQIIDGIKEMALDYYSIPNVIKRSFTNTNYNPYKVFVKLVRNTSIRKFYLTEKLTI